jgi:hypothetical protein
MAQIYGDVGLRGLAAHAMSLAGMPSDVNVAAVSGVRVHPYDTRVYLVPVGNSASLDYRDLEESLGMPVVFVPNPEQNSALAMAAESAMQGSETPEHSWLNALG